ncbi:WXG100 family type VII secretion target [Streptomyces sp. NPDC059402]|uniref:WXG100 family type VII secretion target n=1 Tax=unclassified Streptomyces TaxID=2593676 RepID=UPI0036BC6B6C
MPIYVGQGLETAGQDINAAAQHIMGELHALKSRIQSLIDTWNAQSATDYQLRMHEWDMAAVGLFGSRTPWSSSCRPSRRGGWRRRRRPGPPPR